MPEPSDDTPQTAEQLGFARGRADPSSYSSKDAKVRFALAKFHGMGPDGEWTVEEIAEALDVHPRQVSRYLNESQLAEEVEEVLAVTKAEWRLDMAIQLRREVKRLEEIEQELLQQKQAVATDYDSKTVRGSPTGDRNISLSDAAQEYRLEIPVPTDFETVTDYGPSLEKVQKEKRQYLAQIADLLGLDEADKKEVDHTLEARSEEVKILEVRDTDDPYPEADVVDAEDGDAAAAQRLADNADAEPVETVEANDASDGSGE